MAIARSQSTTTMFSNPRPLVALLRRPGAGYAWFFLRLYVGWQWLGSGWQKLQGPGSVGWAHAGTVGGKPMPVGGKLLAFWQHAVAPPSPSGMPAVAFPWYRDFLQTLIAHHAERWFAYLVAAGEFLVGMALLLGLLTAVAAAFGAFLNLNYMLAGSASLNPVLFLGALLLLAWRVAGYVGLDRWLLPLLGTPWQPGLLFRRGAATAAQPRRAHTPQPERHAGSTARERTLALRRRHLA